jgi:hypothetical protein
VHGALGNDGWGRLNHAELQKSNKKKRVAIKVKEKGSAVTRAAF